MMDAYDLWEHREIELERRLARRPVCDRCGNHIQDETAIEIDGKVICESCIDNLRISVGEYDEDL